MNSPVSLSMLTWVTCMGLVGVDIVGRRGELTRLLIKAEKLPFFFPVEFRFHLSPSSPLYLARGLLLPDGGVSILPRNAVNEFDCFSCGVRYWEDPSAVWYCAGGGGRWVAAGSASCDAESCRIKELATGR